MGDNKKNMKKKSQRQRPALESTGSHAIRTSISMSSNSGQEDSTSSNTNGDDVVPSHSSPRTDEARTSISSTMISLFENNNSNDATSDIWYFGYGPIVNAAVRERRGVHTRHHQAALLPNHRLTFAYGGVANIVPATGYTVQGIVMQICTAEDWNKLQAFDAGQYQPNELQVYPYDAIDHSYDDPVEAFDASRAVTAHVFVMAEFDETQLSKPIETKPQERYLKLISQGMLQHGADPTYVQDEIMACPYIPSRLPASWYTFDQIKPGRLPKITMAKYEAMCRQATATSGDLYFILHDTVLKASPHDPANPSSQWMRCHAHGKTDVSFMVHTIVVDPDLPFCGTEAGMKEQHYKWAENHIFEFLQLAGITATKVFRLVHPSTNATNGRTWRHSLRQALARREKPSS